MARRSFYSNSRITKAKLKDEWKSVKTPKWRYQTADNWRDGITDGFCIRFPMEPHSYYFNKEYNKAIKSIKHKLYFKIPFDENDKIAISKWDGILDTAKVMVSNIKCRM